MLSISLLIGCNVFALTLNAQTTLKFADSVRKHYNIPELGYAIVSSSRILELKTIGVRKINSSMTARQDDRFRIGSNTKAITGFIAALIVKENKIKWDTRFFEMFPELQQESDPAYYGLTLKDLLSFRTKLFAYTYTNTEPRQEQFKGDENEQRYQFAQWFFQHEPVSGSNEINFSNLGYVAAALMLEKASGRSYKDLVRELGLKLNIDFGFGSPNATDSLQTWGHDQALIPEKPANNYKLSWLLAAGNINLTLQDYSKFIQEQLKGLNGKSKLLTSQEYEFLHYGLPGFAIGWVWTTDVNNHRYSYNFGNPGTFLSKVYVYKDADIGVIVLGNAQTPASDEGLSVLYQQLVRRYVNKP